MLMYQTKFRCMEAQVLETRSEFPSKHFLTIPREIRDEVYYLILEDNTQNANTERYSHRPRNDYDGLQLVCRQIWAEVQLILTCNHIPCNRIEKFFARFGELVDKRILLSLKTLTIELPFNSPQEVFTDFATVLEALAPELEYFRLYFCGSDKYGVRSRIHGCGMRDPGEDSTSQKLAIQGQGFQQRWQVFGNLVHLSKLRVLVISNPQFPLLQGMLLSHKPYLKKLHILTDPRQTLHTEFINPALQHLIVPTSDNSQFSPIRQLQISTNAALTSFQVAARVVRTLEELNWTVPDSSRQTGTMGRKWLSETASLLGHLHRSAKNLRVLRVCIEGAIYESHHDYGALVGAFKDSLPLMTTMQVLELHFTSRSPWLGKEILESIPKSLTRLYISDTTTQTEDIVRGVSDMFMGSSWKRFQQFHTKNRALDHSRYNDLDEGIVGEELMRFDCIQMKNSLAFVGFEFSGSEAVELELLKINGKLLDRERNQHLRAHQRQHIPVKMAANEDQFDDLSKAEPVPLHVGRTDLGSHDGEQRLRRCDDERLPTRDQLRLAQYADGKSGKDIQDPLDEKDALSELSRRMQVFSLDQEKRLKPRYGITQTALTQLGMSQLKEDKRYFGNEKEAEKVFVQEVVAKIEDLPILTLPVIVDVKDSDHWMS